MMRRAAALIVSGLALALVHCASPSASGTKTNWFQSCNLDAECGEEGSCTCGLCTQVCTENAGCEEGQCAAELESSSVCQTSEPQRICLPLSEAECVSLDVASDPDLGPAIPPNCEGDQLVCESFDRSLPEQYSTWVEGDMTTSIQDCDVARGASALHYQSDTAGQAQTRIRLPSSILSGALHARLYLKLDARMVLPERLQLLEFWDREESDVPGRVALFLSADGVPAVFVGASSTTLARPSATPLPRDKWMCLELVLDIAGTDGSAALLLEGEEILGGNGFATRPEQPVSVVVIEAQPTTETEGVNLSIDELVVSTAPIGCE